MDAGRVLALFLTTRSGAVLAERFHGRLSEGDRGDVRAAVAATGARAAEAGRDGAEAVGRHRAAAVVSRADGELMLHAVGTGDQDELSLARTLRSIAAALRDALTKGRPLTEAAAVEGYGAVVVVMDGAAVEGVAEAGAPGAGRAARVRGVE